MNALLASEIEQVSGGLRVLQEVGNYLGVAAGASLLFGPEAIPLSIAFGLGAAAFLITDSFVD